MFSRHLSKTQTAALNLVTFCIVIIIVRVQITESIRYVFLIWNLFLALVPYLISEILLKTKPNKVKLIFSLIIWLLFLPNAPYIITDIIHFHNIKSLLLWYDLFTLFSYASTGLILCVFSMFTVYKLVKEKWSTVITEISFAIICFLCGFGIYLGRFLRFNSWDIIYNPCNLLIDSLQCFLLAKCWYITLGFGFLQWMIFKSLKIWKEIN